VSRSVGKLVSVENVYTYSGYEVDDLYTLDRQSGYRTPSLVVAPMRSHDGMSVGVLQLTNVVDEATGATNFPCIVGVSARMQQVFVLI
jgi:hypothetical protein